MPHSTGQQLARYLLAVLAVASPLLVQAGDDTLAPVVDLNPRHNEAASRSLDEPKSLIVAAEAVPLLDVAVSPTKPRDNSATQHKASQPQPAVRFAAPFDPTAGTQPQPSVIRTNARQAAASLPPVIRVYEPIRPSQSPRLGGSRIAANTSQPPKKPVATPSPVLETVHRPNSLATRTNGLARQSNADEQRSEASASEPSGFIKIAERDPIAGKSELESPSKIESPHRTTPLVTEASRSPIETPQTAAAIASRTKSKDSPAKATPPTTRAAPQGRTVDIAATGPKQLPPVVDLATNPVLSRVAPVTLTPRPAIASNLAPVVKLSEETLPQRTAPKESLAPKPVANATTSPLIQLADAEPLLAVLQPSPSASDLPAPITESPLTEQQREVEYEITEFERDVKPINKLSIQTKPEAGELPRDYASARFAREDTVTHHMGISRAKMETLMMWEAPASCHRPLYFEEINLERHGYKVPLVQPAISAAHFFGRVPLLPYMMVSEGHRKCHYTLGHYRPGDYAPYSLYVPRLRLDASAAEVMLVAGVLFAFP